MKIASTKERLLKYLENKGVTTAEFYRQTAIKRGFLDGDKLKAKVNDEMIAQIIATYPELDLLWLISGQGSMFNDNNVGNISVTAATREVVGVMPAVVTVDSSGRDNIVLVPTPAAAGYLNGYGDREFIEQLPAYSLPQMRNGTYRMFQVDGQSMYPTLADKSFVVGEFVEDWAKQIKDDRIYVLVTLSDGVIVKRVLNRIDKYNNIYCKSDNRKNYPNMSVNPKDIIEVWEVKMHLSYSLPNPAEMYDRLNDLEADMEFLKDQLNKKLSN